MIDDEPLGKLPPLDRRNNLRPTEEEFQRGLANIPKDRRNKSQVLCGEPLFERSALYKKLNPEPTRFGNHGSPLERSTTRG